MWAWGGPGKPGALAMSVWWELGRGINLAIFSRSALTWPWTGTGVT